MEIKKIHILSSKALHTVLQFVFPTQCVHCSQLTQRFDRILCQHCFDLIAIEQGEWQSATWIPFHKDSPLNSLWYFAKAKNYTKPIKLLAALCIAQWCSAQKFIPDVITWYPDPEKIIMKNKCCKYLAHELACFFGVKAIEIFFWEIDPRVFDDQGKILANCRFLEEVLGLEGKRCLIVSEKELVMPNPTLQNMQILQLLL